MNNHEGEADKRRIAEEKAAKNLTKKKYHRRERRD